MNANNNKLKNEMHFKRDYHLSEFGHEVIAEILEKEL